MRPAFSSTRQASVFVIMLIAVLLSPALVGKKFLPSREQSYAVQGWDNGPYPWIRQQIYEETNDIDIAFVGSSLMMWGIDTPYVEAQLSKQLGRPAVVRSICWGGTGYDGLYFITQDLLEHRKIHLLVFYDENNVLKNYRNTQAPIWFRYGDNAEALSGLPLNEKTLLYFSAIIGMPRNMLSLLVRTVPMPLTSAKPNYMERMFHTPNPTTRLGSVAAELGCTPMADGQAFAPYVPHSMVQPEDVCIFSAASPGSFQFANEPLPAWQKHFSKKFAAKAAQSGCSLVLLDIPLLDTNRPAVLRERAFWPDLLHCDISILGIPPARLFAGLSDDEIFRLYANAGHRNNAYASHLNRNGQEYFTKLITPSILKLYESQTNH
jgi:hypothetical protein